MLTYSLDQALDRPDLSPQARRGCLKSLRKMCGRHGLLPTSLKAPIPFEQTGDALYRGGCADVWKWVHAGQDVAVKVIRTYISEDLQRVIKVSCWLCSGAVWLCANSALYRGSARRLLCGKPSNIQMSYL